MKRSQIAAAVLLASGCVQAMAATYQVTPLPLQDIARDSFAQSIDNSGKMLAVVSFEYNPPVDVQQLENDTIFFNTTPLENTENVKNGIFSNNDYTVIYNFLQTQRGSGSGQQLASNRSFVTDTVSASLVPGFDIVTEQFNDYTHSVVTIARDSLNGDYIVGGSEDVYIVEPFEQDDGDIVNFTYNQFLQRAFVQVNGQTFGLLPIDTTLGGISEAFAINQNLQVAGLSSVEFSDAVATRIEECETGDASNNIPVDFCKQRIRSSPTLFRFQSKIRPTIWQLDASGQVIDTTFYPLVFTPADDDETFYTAEVTDINNNGIAVGTSQTGEIVLVTRPQQGGRGEPETVAVTYQNGQTTRILPDEENIMSQASGINDNNWVTGTVLRARGDFARSQVFAYNLDTNEALYPDGFFIGSGVTVNAINNNNIVVGKGDIESTNEAVREVSAFMFNIDTQEFIDLNSLIACDTPYKLLEAVDINDNNEIIVNARVRQPSTFITGEQALNSAGETVLRDNIVTVKLTPEPNGEVEECVDEGGLELERQGASLSAFLLFLFGGFAAWRAKYSR